MSANTKATIYVTLIWLILVLACSEPGGIDTPRPGANVPGKNLNVALSLSPASNKRGTASNPPRNAERPRRAPEPGLPGGATARCRDGTLSYSRHRRGTCSHHGGVAVWLY